MGMKPKKNSDRPGPLDDIESLLKMRLSDEDYKVIEEAFEEGHAIEARKVETRGCRHFIRHCMPCWDQDEHPGCWWIQCYCAEGFVVDPELLKKHIYEEAP